MKSMLGAMLVLAAGAWAEEAPPVGAPARSLDAFAGDYRSKGGEEVYVRRMGDRLILLNRTKVVQLEPQGGLAYAGGGMQVDFREGADGGIEGIACRKDQAVFKASRVPQPFRMEECAFQNGEVKLSGTLLMPEGPGPHPALIVVYGSGAWSRNFCLPESCWVAFARAGVAVLNYDKRGCGVSTGDWIPASTEDLAGDALAALGALQKRARIDPKRIGLWGISQGGGIVPVAATKNPDVAFAILVSAAAVGGEQDDQRVLYEMLRSGVERARAEEGLAGYQALRPRLFDAGRGGDKGKILALLKEGRQAWWGEYAFPAVLPDSYYVDGYSQDEPSAVRQEPQDPRAILEKVACPVLAVYGEKDACVPPEINAPLLEESLRKHNLDVTVRIFPDADHLINLTKTGTIAETLAPGGSRTPAPGYCECMIDWVRARMKPAGWGADSP